MGRDREGTGTNLNVVVYKHTVQRMDCLLGLQKLSIFFIHKICIVLFSPISDSLGYISAARRMQ